MIETVIEYSRYLVALLFGTVMAVNFAGMEKTHKNYIVFGCLNIILYIFQAISLQIGGMDVAMKLYPLLSHLPITIFLVVYLKRPLLISLTSVFVSFLCYQVPRWVGTITGVIFSNITMNHVGYIVTAFLMYYLLKKYAVKSIRHLMERSVKSCLLFGAMPTFYYIFEHTSTVYTDFMYSGSRAAVQFMPS